MSIWRVRLANWSTEKKTHTGPSAEIRTEALFSCEATTLAVAQHSWSQDEEMNYWKPELWSAPCRCKHNFTFQPNNRHHRTQSTSIRHFKRNTEDHLDGELRRQHVEKVTGSQDQEVQRDFSWLTEMQRGFLTARSWIKKKEVQVAKWGFSSCQIKTPACGYQA